MASIIETRWEILAILGGGIPPFTAMLDDLDRLFARPELAVSDLCYEHVADFFRPSEDIDAQHRQSAARKAHAVAWALDRHGALPEWLELAGISLDDAAKAADDGQG